MFKINQLQDVRQTPEYTRFMEKIGWKIIRFTSEVAYVRKLPFFPFSILKILRYRPPLPETELLRIIKKYHAILIKLQPLLLADSRFQIPDSRFPPDSSPLIPTKTIWFDLSQSKEQLLKQMKPKTRYNLKKAIKNFLKTPPRWPDGLLGGGGFKIISGDKITNQQLKAFHQLWSKNKPFNFLFKPSFYELKSLVESFGKKCFFIFITINNQQLTINNLLAACLILTSRNMAAYWHNFSTLEAKKLFSPTLYVWEAIKEAKRRQLKIFDFEGIWDERLPKLNQGWKGFSHFKESFGGKIISFAWPKKSFRFF